MRKLAIFLLLIVCVSCLGGGLSSAAFAASDEVSNHMDTSYVLEDLAGAYIDGKIFSPANYPHDVIGQLRLISVMEYAYSDKDELRDYYGLYFYIYNPRMLSFGDSELNKVEIATEYEQVNGEPKITKYEKLHLKICSISANNLLLKLRVEDPSKLYARVSATPEERRYDISGIELIKSGDINAIEYKVGGTWVFTGYSRGCGVGESASENTLQCTARASQTLDLDDLHFTYYRNEIDHYHSAFNSEDYFEGGFSEQLNSVYFSVPNFYLDYYKRLYSIQAETYRYLTAPIICIQMTDAGNAKYFYEQLLPYRGIYDPAKRDDSLSTFLYWDCGTGLVYGTSFAYTVFNRFTGGNLDNYHYLHTLSWLFNTDKFEDISVQSNELLNYAKDYSEQFGNKEVLGKYSADLFADHYYSRYMKYKPFENGYYPIDLNVSGETDFVFTETDSSQSFWDCLFGGTAHVQGKPFSPIELVTTNDLKGLSDDEIAQKYYMQKSDAKDFYDYVNDNPDRAVYLFHFGMSDYFSNRLRSYFRFGVYGWYDVGFLAQEVAYLDFDIISLGFENDFGAIEILPVVSSPVDVYSAIDNGAPATWWDRFVKFWSDLWNGISGFFSSVWSFFTSNWWLLIIVGVLILLVLLSIFFPVFRVVFKWIWAAIKWIFKILWYIISAPVRFVVWIVNKVKERKENSG